MFTKQHQVTIAHANTDLSGKLDIYSESMEVTEDDDIPEGDEVEGKKSKVMASEKDGKHDTSRSRLIVDDLKVKKFIRIVTYHKKIDRHC